MIWSKDIMYFHLNFQDGFRTHIVMSSRFHQINTNEIVLSDNHFCSILSGSFLVLYARFNHY